MAPNKRIIIDTDAGTDDAHAILMALEADKAGDVQVLAITCVNGNTAVDNVCQNVLRVLTTVGRLDIPVYRGAESALVEVVALARPPYHGKDGFGDVNWPEPQPSKTLIQEEHAVNALLRHVNSNPGEITLVFLGPLTNAALAMRMDPSFASKVKEIHIMGGNSEGQGNIEVAREFNFWCDPDSAYIVLNSTKCPTFIVPWETCLKQIQLPFSWRRNVLGSVDTPQAALMNQIEHYILNNEHHPYWVPCDQVSMAALLDPNLVTFSMNEHATVELHGSMTRGLMLVDHRKHLGQPENVTIVHKVDVEVLKKRLMLGYTFSRS